MRKCVSVRWSVIVEMVDGLRLRLSVRLSMILSERVGLSVSV